MTDPPIPAASARRIALDGDLAPERAIELLGEDGDQIVLSGEWAGVRAVAASDPLELAPSGAGSVAALSRQAQLRDCADGVSVGGGWLGRIGYGAACEQFDPSCTFPPKRECLPDAALAFYDHVLVLDLEGRWWLEMLWTEMRAEELHRRSQLLTQRLSAAAAKAPSGFPRDATGPWQAEPTEHGHARAVAACQERIAAGDLYQANLALRLRSVLRTEPSRLFEVGVAALSPQRGAYAAGEWGAVVSLSPELLLSRKGDRVLSEPIKGTRPRPEDEQEAAALAQELADSEKDRAENVMIVDLMRNDLGQVCTPGSVIAEPVCEVRELAGVWHLVSSVRGTLPAGTDDGTVAAAVLPAGSVTGTPKLAALATVSELESASREAFCGSFALASPIAGLELSVAIRTLECSDEKVWLDVGGGVTAASDPAEEAAECLAKAEPILRAIGADVPSATAATAGPAPLRIGPTPLPRPTPSQGIFTTMRADGGRASHLTEHLARLESSSLEVFGVRLPDRLRREVRDTAAQSLEPQRLRVTILPSGEADVEAWTIDAPEGTVVLEPVCVPGGLGTHKWADRRLVGALEQHTAPAEPLLCDLDGTVLEATRWALVAEIDGALVTPPADGRILPSLSLEMMHAAIRPEPRTLQLADLGRASAVYVTNAVRGMVSVSEVRGVWRTGG